MIRLDGSPARGSADRRQARRDVRSTPRRDPNVPRDRRGPDCDFTPSSMESLRRPFQRTDHNTGDKDERRPWDRPGKDRDPDRLGSNDRGRNRNRKTKSINDRERNPNREPMSIANRERRGLTVSIADQKKDRKSNTTPRQKTNVPGKKQEPEPTPSNEPPQSLLQQVVPENIRRSIYFLKDYLLIEDREPIIGLEYILEYRVQMRECKVEVKYFCELCVMDSGVIPMLDHLCGFKHRKLYVTKEYPYVLKPLFSTKEDQRGVFLRRLAVEIEEEEGTKMYKSDDVIRMVPMMNVKTTEAKQSKKRITRWNCEGEVYRKMNSAMKILDSFEIADDDEAATVTKLLQKVTSVVKIHTEKLKRQSLFPMQVARAKDIGKIMVKNAIKARLAEQNIFPLLELGNVSLHTLGRPFYRQRKPFLPPGAALPQRPQESPLNRNPQMPLADLEIEETDEDIEFFKQLIALLDLLPEGPTNPTTSKMDSEILMLQSFLLDNQANPENAPANQLMQAGPLTRDLASMDNVSPYQQLNRLAPKNPAAMAQFKPNLSMPVASAAQNAAFLENVPADQNLLMQMVELIQSTNPSMNASLPEKQNLQNRECIERVNSSAVIMQQTAHRPPNMERQPEFTTSRSKVQTGFEQQMAGSDENIKKRQYDDKSMGYRSTEPKKSANRAIEGYRAEQAPFPRVSLPSNIQRLEKERLQDVSYERDLRAEYRSQEASPNYSGLSSRSFDDPAWAERERDQPYGKRAKLDSDFSTTRNTDGGQRYPDERGSIDAGIPNLSADLLKKIRGKDLLTASAILGEFTK